MGWGWRVDSCTTVRLLTGLVVRVCACVRAREFCLRLYIISWVLSKTVVFAFGVVLGWKCLGFICRDESTPCISHRGIQFSFPLKKRAEGGEEENKCSLPDCGSARAQDLKGGGHLGETLSTPLFGFALLARYCRPQQGRPSTPLSVRGLPCGISLMTE